MKERSKENFMKLISPVFENNGKIPALYTCDGDDVSPPLYISDVPGKTKSLVLIMDDPDAVRVAGRVWDHWIVWNISPKIKEIKENEELRAIFGRGTSGNVGYKGPCPPDDGHRYYFKLYALDTELSIPEGSGKARVEKAMEGHVLGQAELVGLYTRKISL